MFVELFCAGLLLGWIENPVIADDGPAAPEWVATVRSVSMKPGQSWTLELHGSSPTRTSARLWWIDGPAAHTGFPAHLVRDAGLEEEDLPDLIHARQTDLTAGECSALGEIAAQLDKLTISPVQAAVRPIDPPAMAFVLETPGNAPVDLTTLPPSHPVVRWAQGAWEELSDCAGVRIR